ncbi:MAG: O-succinylhomoserine sulfhydrylase [Methylococcales bacterium]|jgi:O-succinylhomoserine sulfhydrylase|nr:O-succinylhomoserine sulfhydrylase [Methylococcales bacterium]MBT7444850.1 O-succinylhomoserine sulfhydrylase [Methylococcales bacterium]
MDNKHIDTIAVRAGQVRTAEGEHSDPMFLTSSYVFASAEEAQARFSGDSPGNIYSRFTNPTVRTFEQRLAAMEGGEVCVATASGMSAIVAFCMGTLQAGDHIVSSRSIFGSTVILFNNIMSKFGIETTYVDLTDLDDWRKAIRPNTKAFFAETPSNPLTQVVDIAALSEISREKGIILAIDNCFCTPSLQKPLTLGADVVIHSATKYLDGQGRCIGGAVVGKKDLVGEGVYSFLRTAGPTMSPFNAWVFLTGLETLGLRMKQHCANAQQVAEWLSEQPNVSKVHFPGLESHPQYDVASRQQSGPGGLLSFEVKGGQEKAFNVINKTEFLSITANLGDTKTTITHPATTTHGRLTDEQKLEAGIAPGLVRVAVGLENVDDIIHDLSLGLS